MEVSRNELLREQEQLTLMKTECDELIDVLKNTSKCLGELISSVNVVFETLYRY